MLEPRPAGGPVDANTNGSVEVDGVEFTDWKRKMTLREVM